MKLTGSGIQSRRGSTGCGHTRSERACAVGGVLWFTDTRNTLKLHGRVREGWTVRKREGGEGQRKKERVSERASEPLILSL